MADEYDPTHPYMDPSIPLMSSDASYPLATCNNPASDEISANEEIDATEMSFAACNEGSEDEGMTVDEADFSDGEQDGESKKDHTQATKDNTDTSEIAQLSDAMRNEYAGYQSAAAKNDLLCQAIDEVFATERHASTDKILDAIEPEPEKNPTPDIPDEINVGGNLKAALEAMTKDDVIKKCLDLDDALNMKWKKQRDDEATLEALGVIPVEEVTNRYSLTSFYSFHGQSEGFHYSGNSNLTICCSLSQFCSEIFPTFDFYTRECQFLITPGAENEKKAKHGG